MFEYEHYTTLLGNELDMIDPEGLACRFTLDGLADIAAVAVGCYNYGMSIEDAALLVLSSETLIQ